ASEGLALLVSPLFQLLHSAVEVNEHNDTGLGRHASQRDEANRDCHREVEAEPPHQPKPADKRERHRQHDDQGLGYAPEVQVQQQKDNQHGHGYDHLEPRLGPLQIFKLPTPDRVIARWKCDLAGDGLLCIGDVAADVAVANVDIDVGGKLRVFGSNARRTLGEAHVRDLAEWYRATIWQWNEHLIGNGFLIATIIPRIANADGIALPSLDRSSHGLRTECHGNHALH